MLIERLMWGSDWNDPRLMDLLRNRPPASTCAACDRPVEVDERPGSEGRLLCARCDAPDSAS